VASGGRTASSGAWQQNWAFRGPTPLRTQVFHTYSTVEHLFQSKRMAHLLKCAIPSYDGRGAVGEMAIPELNNSGISSGKSGA